MRAKWGANYKITPSKFIWLLKNIVLNKQDLKVKNTFNRGEIYWAPILSVYKITLNSSFYIIWKSKDLSLLNKKSKKKI